MTIVISRISGTVEMEVVQTDLIHMFKIYFYMRN